MQQGEYPKVISERLGHASTAFTNDLYSHLMPGMEQAAAAKIDVALQGVITTSNWTLLGEKMSKRMSKIKREGP